MENQKNTVRVYCGKCENCGKYYTVQEPDCKNQLNGQPFISCKVVVKTTCTGEPILCGGYVELYPKDISVPFP